MTNPPHEASPSSIRLQVDLTGLDASKVQGLLGELRAFLAARHTPAGTDVKSLVLATPAQVEFAQDQAQAEGETEIDDDTVLSLAGDRITSDGAYVSAWVWVDGIGQPLTPERLGLILDNRTGRPEPVALTRLHARLLTHFGPEANPTSQEVQEALDQLGEHGPDGQALDGQALDHGPLERSAFGSGDADPLATDGSSGALELYDVYVMAVREEYLGRNVQVLAASQEAAVAQIQAQPLSTDPDDWDHKGYGEVETDDQNPPIAERIQDEPGRTPPTD